MSPRPFRIASVNLYSDEIDWLDEVQSRLRRRGLTKFTRSEVVRLAVNVLRRQLHGASDSELVHFVLQELVAIRHQAVDVSLGHDEEVRE